MFSVALRAYQSLLVGGVGASVARFSGALQIRYASTTSFDVAKSKRLLLSPPFACGSAPALQKYNYVDKTALLARIMSTEATFLIATSMRRSGKSLVLNQLAEMARGNLALFEGYEVTKDDSPFKFGAQKFSLIQLDFSRVLLNAAHVPFDPVLMQLRLMNFVAAEALQQHNIVLSNLPGSDLGTYLNAWVLALLLKEGNLPIVLLIDEYDAPVASCFSTTLIDAPGWCAGKHADAVADILKSFYIVTKSLDKHFHKVFVTGALLV